MVFHGIAVLLLAVCGLELAFLVKSGWWVPPFPVSLDKPTLAPIRVAHFCCVLILGRALLPRDSRLVKIFFLRPVIVCGQHPLATYCAGGLLATLGTLLLSNYGASFGWTLFINLFGWTASILVAQLVASRQTRKVA